MMMMFLTGCYLYTNYWMNGKFCLVIFLNPEKYFPFILYSSQWRNVFGLQKTIFGIFSPYGNFNAKQSHIKIYGKKGEMSKLIAAVLLFFRRTKCMYVWNNLISGINLNFSSETHGCHLSSPIPFEFSFWEVLQLA